MFLYSLSHCTAGSCAAANRTAVVRIFHRQIVRKKCENVSIAQNAALSLRGHAACELRYCTLTRLELVSWSMTKFFFFPAVSNESFDID